MHAVRMAHRTVGHGHWHQGRFKSFPVQSDEHFLTVARKVKGNALGAGQVARAESWPYCSLFAVQAGGADMRDPCGVAGRASRRLGGERQRAADRWVVETAALERGPRLSLRRRRVDRSYSTAWVQQKGPLLFLAAFCVTGGLSGRMREIGTPPKATGMEAGTHQVSHHGPHKPTQCYSCYS